MKTFFGKLGKSYVELTDFVFNCGGGGKLSKEQTFGEAEKIEKEFREFYKDELRNIRPGFIWDFLLGLSMMATSVSLFMAFVFFLGGDLLGEFLNVWEISLPDNFLFYSLLPSVLILVICLGRERKHGHEVDQIFEKFKIERNISN